MLDMMRKTVLAGIGAISLTKEKAEGIVDELVKRGEASHEKYPRMVRVLLERAEKERTDLERKVHGEVERAIGKLGIPTRTEFAELNRKIDELMDQVRKPEKQE